MKLFKKFQALFHENTAAAHANTRALAAAERNHEAALMRDQEVDEQARALHGMNQRNHFSESLTLAFRGGRTS